MPIIYSYSSSGRSREGEGNQDSGSRDGREGMASRSTSTRSMYIGGSRSESTSRNGVNIIRRNSSSAVDGGSGAVTWSGIEMGALDDEPEPTDADESIFLSDLVRTGEASRLRRRGAMRIDHHHLSRGDGPLATSTPQNNGNPTRTGSVTGIGRRLSSYRTVDSAPSFASFFNGNTGFRSSRLDSPSNRNDGDGWVSVQPTSLRRTSINIGSSRNTDTPPQDHDQESYTYTLFCGYEPEPGTEEYVAYREHWAEEEFLQKQMCEPFEPSPFPLPPPSSASLPKGKGKATSYPNGISNGCGALIHLRAAPRARMGVWMAKTEASNAVIAMDPDYFLDSTSDVSGRTGSRSSSDGNFRTIEGRSGSSAMVKVNIVKSACGCIREGVGCAVCGNPLGTRYKPCKTAAESIFSNARGSRSRGSQGVSGASASGSSASGGPSISSRTSVRRGGPHGPTYWRPTSVHSQPQYHLDPLLSSNSQNPSTLPFSSSSTPSSKFSDQPFYIYTFFSGAVTSSPRFSFSSANSSPTSSSRPSASRNVSTASSNTSTASSSETMRPTLVSGESSDIPSSIPPAAYLPAPASTASLTSPTPSSAVTASSAATISIGPGASDSDIPPWDSPGRLGAPAEVRRERGNRTSLASLASTVTVVSVNGPEDSGRDTTSAVDVVGYGVERERGEVSLAEERELSTSSASVSGREEDRVEGMVSSFNPMGDTTSSSVMPGVVSGLELESPYSPSTPTPSLAATEVPVPASPHSPMAVDESMHVADVSVRGEGNSGRPVPRRRARVGEDEAEEALRRAYGGYEVDGVDGVLVHTLPSVFVDSEDNERGREREMQALHRSVTLPRPTLSGPVILDSVGDERRDSESAEGGVVEADEHEAHVEVAGAVRAAVDSVIYGTPVTAAVNTVTSEPESELILVVPERSIVPTPVTSMVVRQGAAITSSSSFPARESVDTNISPELGGGQTLFTPTAVSLTAQVAPVRSATFDTFDSAERVDAGTVSQSRHPTDESLAVDNTETIVQTTNLSAVRTHAQHMLALIRRAREQAQERREGMLDFLMVSSSISQFSDGNANINANTNSFPPSPSSTTSASSLPPLVFPPTPSASSLHSLVSSPAHFSDSISRFTDIIRRARDVAESSGRDRQQEWSAFEEWMAMEENQIHHVERNRDGEEDPPDTEPVIPGDDDFNFDSDTESELEGRIVIPQNRPAWMYMDSYSLAREGTENYVSLMEEGDETRLDGARHSREVDDGDDDDNNAWGQWSMPTLQDVSDSEQDLSDSEEEIRPAVWDDSSDEDGDPGGNNRVDEDMREEPSRSQMSNTVFDPDGEFLDLDSLDGNGEDLDKPGEPDRIRMGLRVPTNIVAGR